MGQGTTICVSPADRRRLETILADHRIVEKVRRAYHALAALGRQAG